MDAEIIYLQILNKNTICNFLACYNPNKNLTESFLDTLEKDFLFKINLEQNLFIMGDLNQDLLSNDGQKLADFIKNY